MAEKALRFGVADGHARAATWKLWTPANRLDIYLACRELSSELKASFHESGEWHIAHTREVFEDSVQDAIPLLNSRFLEKWNRPKPLAPGVTLAFRVVTLWSSVTTPIDDLSQNIVWIPSAPHGHITEVDILMTAPSVHNLGWPGQSMGTKLVGSYPLSDGSTVWAVYMTTQAPEFLLAPRRGSVWFYKGKSVEDLKSSGLRAFAFGDEPDGSHVVYDLAGKWTEPDSNDV